MINKINKRVRRYSTTDKNKVIKHHLKGLTDQKIADKLNFGRSYVQKITTDFWKNKMKPHE